MLRRAPRVLATILVVASLGSAAAPQALADSGAYQDDRRERDRRYAAAVRFIGVTQRGREIRGNHFDIDRLRHVVILVRWRTLVGAHSQQLEIVSPDGAVYQRLSVPVESVTGQAEVETRLLVAGTWITERRLTGRWRVRVYVDESLRPVTSKVLVLTR
jgi:hypothetical protein